ncbi:spermidine synthase [Luteimicrobium sp. DT211]|uniref:spermidine synthase n=1 Tax=Luteimicrobium sp. DT211 TaxID=3393412 RepID=UPI003CEA36FC
MSARRNRHPRQDPRSSEPPTAAEPGGAGGGGRRRRGAGALPTGLPEGPVATTTGVVELEPDPDRNAVTVLVNGAPSSYVDLDDPGLLTFEYMQEMAALVDALPAGPLRVVHLGAAGCSLARWVEHERPGSEQVAVDLDARLLELVRGWFALPRAPRLRLRAGDARAVLATLRDGWADVVVRDVFAPDTTPPHLATVEFVQDVWRVLRPGGLYLANCADRPPLPLARAEAATLDAAGADDVVVVSEPALLRGRRYGNLVLAARRPPEHAGGGDAVERPDPLADDAALARRLRSLPVPAHVLGGAELASFRAAARPAHDDAAPSEGGRGVS